MSKVSATEAQEKAILKYLAEGYSLTSMQAVKKFDCLRLSARIFNLKKAGHDIVAPLVYDKKTKKNYASYRLANVEPKSEKAIPGKTVADFSKAIKQVSLNTHNVEKLF